MSATGTNGNRRPQFATTGPPSTAVNAAAPPGGCRQRVKDITAIATATAIPVAISGSGTNIVDRTPTKAEIVLPPTIDHGWASGLAGTANSRTADAPIGATINGRLAPPPKMLPLIMPVRRIPTSAPRHAIKRSLNVAPARIGAKKRRPGGCWDAGLGELVMQSPVIGRA